MLVARATYFAFGTPPGVFDPAEVVHDIHGGEIETSLLLHLAPALVRTAALADFKGLPHEFAARNRVLGAEKPVGIGWRAEDLHPSGACGNAARADAQKGAKHLAYLAERLALLVGELGRDAADDAEIGAPRRLGAAGVPHRVAFRASAALGRGIRRLAQADHGDHLARGGAAPEDQLRGEGRSRASRELRGNGGRAPRPRRRSRACQRTCVCASCSRITTACRTRKSPRSRASRSAR